jgi:quinol monooxygenase YgiN
VTISVVAVVKAREGQEAQFEAVARRLVAAVRASEPGCLQYTLNRGEDASTFVFIERYRDEDAVKAHRASDHMDGPPDVRRMTELT